MSESESDGRVATGDRHDEYEWKDNQAWTYHANVDPAGFNSALQTLDGLTGECVLELGPDGLSIQACDPARVAAVDVTSECVHRADGVVRVGVNLSSLVGETPAYYPDNDPEYDVEISHDGGGETEDYIRVSNLEGNHRATTFDPESVREAFDEWPEPDDPYQVDVTLPTPKVRGILGALADLSDAHIHRVTPEDGALCVVAETQQKLGSPRESICEWTIDADVTSGPSGLYSADYLADICEGLYPDGETRVRFGNEQFLELSTDGLRYVVAPRIDGDDA